MQNTRKVCRFFPRLITAVTENRGGTRRDIFFLFVGKKMTTGRDGTVKFNGTDFHDGTGR